MALRASRAAESPMIYVLLSESSRFQSEYYMIVCVCVGESLLLSANTSVCVCVHV